MSEKKKKHMKLTEREVKQLTKLLRFAFVFIVLLLLIEFGIAAVISTRDAQFEKNNPVLLLISVVISIIICVGVIYLIKDEVKKNKKLVVIAIVLNIIFYFSEVMAENLTMMNIIVLSFGLETLFFKISYIPRIEREKHEIQKKLSVINKKDEKYKFDDFLYKRRTDESQNYIRLFMYCLVILPSVGCAMINKITPYLCGLLGSDARNRIGAFIAERSKYFDILLDLFAETNTLFLLFMIFWSISALFYMSKSKELEYSNSICNERKKRDLSDKKELKKFKSDELCYIFFEDNKENKQ